MLQNAIAMICLSAILSPGCTFLKHTKGASENAINPEIAPPPYSQNPIAPKKIEAKFSLPFDKGWKAALTVLQQNGYAIQEADPKEGWIRTQGKQFVGPHYPWRESYSVHIMVERENLIRIKVTRQVKVYRRVLLVGPTVWTARLSNGQREKILIDQITQYIGTTGAGQGEN